VEDSGTGIAPDVLSRLFVSFVATKARDKGTGLGLRICRRIVEEMDGSISASNRAEGGACLEILLPARVPRSCQGASRRHRLNCLGRRPCGLCRRDAASIACRRSLSV
jgi:K+-sensing histidine kinase KdpD